MRMILEIVAGPFGEREHSELSRFLTWLRPGDSLRVGRAGHGVDMCVAADRRMSSSHFAVSCEEEGCFLTDLQSTNGTFVNGQKVTELTRLHDGDMVLAGDTQFSVQIIDPNRSGGSHSSLEIDRTAPDAFTPVGELSDPVAGQAYPLTHFSLEIVAGPGAFPPLTEKQMREQSSATLKQCFLKPNAPLAVGSSQAEAHFHVPDDDEVAPLHFSLEQKGDMCLLSVPEEQPAVAVNNIKVRHAELTGGERITVGKTVLLLRLIDRRSARPTQVPPKQTPALVATEAEVQEKLALLAQGQREVILEVFDWLQQAEPLEQARQRVSQKLLPFTRSSDIPLRQQAASCFARWTNASGQATLQQMLSNHDPVLVQAAIAGLVRVSDYKNVDGVAEALRDKSRQETVTVAIVNHGSEAEKLGIRLLMHEEPQVPLLACRILAEIGGRQSELALQTKLQRIHGDTSVEMQAAVEQALDTVRARIR